MNKAVLKNLRLSLALVNQMKSAMCEAYQRDTRGLCSKPEGIIYLQKTPDLLQE